MAPTRGKRGRRKLADGAQGPGAAIAVPDATELETTGRLLVLLPDGRDGLEAGLGALRERSRFSKFAFAREFGAKSASVAEVPAGADALIFEHLGVAVMQGGAGAEGELAAAAVSGGPVLAYEEERVVYATDAAPLLDRTSPEGRYLAGYRDAVLSLTERMLGEAPPSSEVAETAATWMDTPQLTWGLQAINLGVMTGRGIRLAILDTGLDLGHPDFLGRAIVSQSFVVGEAVQDLHGHGTHCAGTACGPLRPGGTRRYGVAPDAELHVGKVLANNGRGVDGGILAGINWAIAQHCVVVSMSFETPVLLGAKPSMVYEQAAQRALLAGTLLVAAAGNKSSRPGRIAPVSHPANCPSIMAVAALDASLQLPSFSNGGLNPGGGQVDVAAPGVDVFSSARRATNYALMSGTSMATPHVAGVAACIAEEGPHMRGGHLWQAIVGRAQRLLLPSRDVGSGWLHAL